MESKGINFWGKHSESWTADVIEKGSWLWYAQTPFLLPNIFTLFFGLHYSNSCQNIVTKCVMFILDTNIAFFGDKINVKRHQSWVYGYNPGILLQFQHTEYPSFSSFSSWAFLFLVYLKYYTQPCCVNQIMFCSKGERTVYSCYL